jgi:hypothetical protein
VTLRILSLAEADLLDGFRFYERQASGVAWYFLQSLYSISSRFGSTQAHIGACSVIIECFQTISVRRLL